MNKVLKIFFVAILIFAASNFAKSQDLHIVGDSLLSFEANITDNSDIFVTKNINNSGFMNLSVKVKVKVIKMTSGHSFDICWGANCLPPATTDWDNSPIYTLNSLTTTPNNTFYAHYYPYDKDSDPIPGQGVLLYTFYDVNNPADNASFQATFTFTQGNDVSEIFSVVGIKTQVSMDNILNINTNGKLGEYTATIYDLNGNLVYKQTFMSDMNYNLNNLSTGAYLFSVVDANGKKVSNGKFIKN